MDTIRSVIERNGKRKTDMLADKTTGTGKMRKSLSYRLLFYVLLCSSCLTLICTAFQIYVDYRASIDGIEKTFKTIESTYLDMITNSLWNYNERQISIELNGLVNMADIQYAGIIENNAGKPRLAASAGKEGTENVMTRNMPLIYNGSDGARRLGELVVVATLDNVHSKIRAKILVVLVSNAIKTFVASILIFYIFQYVVTRHVVKISRYMRGMDIDGGGPDLTLDRTVGGDGERDEFDFLIGAINKRRAKMAEYLARQRKAETALRESEENLATTLDSIGDGVITANTGLVVTRMNPVAEKLTGWMEDEAAGKSIHDIFKVIDADTDEPVSLRFDKVLAARECGKLSTDLMLETRDGGKRRIADSAAPIMDSNDQVSGVVVVFRDITREYETQQQLHQAQKMDAVGQLAGGVAHDFNNLLACILGSAQILMDSDDGRFTDEQKRDVEMIIKSVRRAADLTRGLLDFSRKGKLQSVKVKVNDVVNHVIELLERTIDRRIKIERRLSMDELFITGDPGQIQNSILNLAINARDAMPDGGTMTFSSAKVTLEQEMFYDSKSSFKPGEYIELSITDTGIGMPKEIRERVFEPFFTTKEVGKGTGLGLSAVYGCIRDHQGDVRVYSEPGKGTVVKLYLPNAAAAKDGGARIIETEAADSGGGETILLADDEEGVRNITARMLTMSGYNVLTAGDGKEALDIFRQKRADISLVILDLMMPVMNGKEAFDALKAENIDIPIIIASGFGLDGDAGQLLENGAAAFFQKPFQKAELLKTIADKMKNGGNI